MELSLFETPLWRFVIGDDTLNQQMLYDGTSYKPGANFFDIDRESIQHLKCEIEKFLFEKWPDKKFHIYGRQNPIKPNSCDTPHSHPNCEIVGVYYVDVPKNSGDILLMDPRFNVPTFWQHEPEIETYKTARPYYRIKPTSGLLILFPSYIVHSVETNLSDKIRMSVAINIVEDKNV
jgi:uncharacterized protein (TIGR02466 family)